MDKIQHISDSGLKALALVIILCIEISVTAGSDSNDLQSAVLFESQEQCVVQVDGKSLSIRKELGLSNVFEAFGAPEDIGTVHHKFFLYGWGITCKKGPGLIVDASPTKNIIDDWAVVWFENDKVVKVAVCSIPGKSRSMLVEQLQDMRKANKIRQTVCPGALWCTTFNLSKHHGHPFEILSDHDVVGPALWVSLHNAGLQPVDVPEELAEHVLLTIETPDKRKYTAKSSEINKLYRSLSTGQIAQVSIPFFSWVADMNDRQDVPIGTYRYYATFLGARSRTEEVIVHRQAFVLPCPNSADEEIVITPYYDKLPIHGLKYDELVEACTVAFKERFEGHPRDVLISAYAFLDMPIPLPDGGHAEGFIIMEESFPLRDFAHVTLRERQ